MTQRRSSFVCTTSSATAILFSQQTTTLCPSQPTNDFRRFSTLLRRFFLHISQANIARFLPIFFRPPHNQEWLPFKCPEETRTCDVYSSYTQLKNKIQQFLQKNRPLAHPAIKNSQKDDPAFLESVRTTANASLTCLYGVRRPILIVPLSLSTTKPSPNSLG